MRAAWLLAAVLAAGCNQIIGIEDTTFGDGGTPDSGPPATCDAPDTITCDERGHIVTCDTDGNVTDDVACPLGCTTAAPPACKQMEVTNGLTRFLSDAAEGVDMVFPNGTSYVLADDGQVIINNAEVSVASEVVDGMRVFAFKSLKIDGQLLTHQTLSDFGGPAIVFVVAGDVEITGLVDVSALRWSWGPGALDPAVVDSCRGAQGGKDNTLASLKGGGGGGGGYSAGAAGGASPTFGGGAGGSDTYDDTLVPLRGGCAGGESGGGGYSGPGGGGGAIQISSATRITITEVGSIDASGGGGSMVPSYAGFAGAGGGGGGAILLEAPTILLSGADVVLSTKGGGGGGNGDNIDGTDQAIGEEGGLGPDPALGGYFGAGYLRGGNGGTTDVAPTPGPASSDNGGTGGGGGVGQTRFITGDGNVTIEGGAAVRSPYTTSQITLQP